MAKITSKDQLKDYIRENLSVQIYEINVDDDQLNDRVDEALRSTSTLIIVTVLSSIFKHQISEIKKTTIEDRAH